MIKLLFLTTWQLILFMKSAFTRTKKGFSKPQLNSNSFSKSYLQGFF